MTTRGFATSTTAELRPSAKINLTLGVLGRRADGYHDLRSLAVGVDLRDTLRCTLANRPGIELCCDVPGISKDENLAFCAARRLAEHVGLEPAVRLDLRKNIPLGSGLGGGSSDAAATLRLCNALWNAGLDDVQLGEIGAQIGSDVPLFFALPAARMTGRGERAEKVPIHWSGWVLLVFAGPLVATREVYAAWRPSHSGATREEAEAALLSAKTADAMNELLFNDLEPAVFCVSPEVAKLHRVLTEKGFGPLRVSGAGSALFRLFDDYASAERIARSIRELKSSLRVELAAAPVGAGSINHEETDDEDYRSTH